MSKTKMEPEVEIAWKTYKQLVELAAEIWNFYSGPFIIKTQEENFDIDFGYDDDIPF